MLDPEKMALQWYCRPVKNGIWEKLDGGFGAYTPCAIDSSVICISHLVVLGLCVYRIWLTKNATKAQKYCLRSIYYNCKLALLAGYCTAAPVFRLTMDISIFDLDGVVPFEVLLTFYVLVPALRNSNTK